MPTNSPAERVAGDVRAAMRRRHVTQAALAAALSLSQAAVSRRLSGSVDFTVTELHIAATLLDVDVAELIGADRPLTTAAAG